MNYLYGDSTDSPLKSNFLEFLRDALDFAVFALQVEHSIRGLHARIESLRAEAAAETARVEAFIAAVTAAIDEAPKGEPGLPTARCAADLRNATAEHSRRSIAAIRAKLEADIAAANAEEAAERARCTAALEALLVGHDPPDAGGATTKIVLAGDAYDATVEGSADLGFAWSIELGAAPSSEWATPLRLERLLPAFVIRAPQLSGWISKDVKIKPQRLEQFVVTELVDDTVTVSFKLRSEPQGGAGFDFEVNLEENEISVIRLADPAVKDDPAAGPMNVDPEDVASIVDLAERLRKSVATLERRALGSATFDDAPFEDHADFSAVVERLIGLMAPITRDIAERSLMPNELVIRRLLGDDRREEIFVTKASLRDKVAKAPDPFRHLFDPLALADGARRRTEVPPVDAPVIRSELPPSMPPEALDDVLDALEEMPEIPRPPRPPSRVKPSTQPPAVASPSEPTSPAASESPGSSESNTNAPPEAASPSEKPPKDLEIGPN